VGEEGAAVSVQQDRYLQLRAGGATMMSAAAQTGIGIGEARLIENEIARGVLVLPAPRPASLFERMSASDAAPGGDFPAFLKPKEAPLAKRAKPNDGNRAVTNLTDAKEMVRQSVPKIINLKKDRAAINEEITAIRANVEAAGVPKKALDHAIRVMEMDPLDRERFDEGYAIARDAIGLGMSRSLFDMLEDPAGDDANPPDFSSALDSARSRPQPVPDAV
jgi:uncharacterized protein (UPF0335 family)